MTDVGWKLMVVPGAFLLLSVVLMVMDMRRTR